VAARPIQRDNVIAGLFLVGSLLLAVVVAFVLSDVMSKLGAFRDYTIRFEIAEGVAGVKVGSPVTLGGLDVGRVTSVAPVFEEIPTGAQLPTALDVSVSIDDRIELYSNADAYVIQPILGTMASINIAHPGGSGKPSLVSESGSLEVRLLAPEDPLDGAIAPALLAQMGLGPEESQLIRQTLEDARRGVGTFRELGDRLRPAVDEGVDNIDATLESFRRTAERIDERTDEISDDLVVIVEDVRGITGRFDPTMTEIEMGIADARATITDIRAAVAENRPVIRRSTENVERITARAELQTMDKIEAVLDEGFIAASSFSDTGARAEALIAQSTPDLRRALGNARVISDQASLFIQEVRAAPWRLLERPKTKEIREQLVYDATRTYASAVGDLRSASETLDAALGVIAAGAPLDVDEVNPAGLALLAEDVRRAFGDYRRAEAALLELVTEGALPAQE